VDKRRCALRLKAVKQVGEKMTIAFHVRETKVSGFPQVVWMVRAQTCG
jgi:hypothetical protein